MKEKSNYESDFITGCEVPWEKGEIVNVSEGYARNMLLPKKLGVEANSKNLNDLKLQNQHADKVAQENLEAAQAMAKKIEEWLVETKIKTGEGGRTFGSVSSKEICAAVKAQYKETIDKKKYTWKNQFVHREPTKLR